MPVLSKPPIPILPERIPVPLDGGFAPASVSSNRYLQFAISNPDMRQFSLGFFWRIHPTYSAQWVQPIVFNSNYVMEYQLPIGSTGYVQLYWNGDHARITLTSSEYDSGDLFYSFVSHITGTGVNTLWNLTKGWVKEATHGSVTVGTAVTAITLGTLPAGAYTPGMMYNFKMWHNKSGKHTREWAEQEMRSFEPVQQHNLVAWYPLGKHYGPNSALNGRPALTPGGSTSYTYNGLPTTYRIEQNLNGMIVRPPFRRMMNFDVPHEAKPDSPDLEIDWSHPLARRLSCALVFDDDGSVARDLTKGQQFAAIADAVISSSSGGLVYNELGSAIKTLENATYYAYGVDWTTNLGPKIDGGTGGKGCSVFFAGKINSATGTRAPILQCEGSSHAFYINPSTRSVNWRASATTIQTSTGVLPTFPCYARIGGTYQKSVAASICLNGVYESTAAGSFTLLGPCEALGNGQGAGALMAEYNLFLMWGDRVLSESELKSLNDNPWQIFKPKRQHIIIPREHLMEVYSQPYTEAPTDQTVQLDRSNSLAPDGWCLLGSLGLPYGRELVQEVNCYKISGAGERQFHHVPDEFHGGVGNLAGDATSAVFEFASADITLPANNATVFGLFRTQNGTPDSVLTKKSGGSVNFQFARNATSAPAYFYSDNTDVFGTALTYASAFTVAEGEVLGVIMRVGASGAWTQEYRGYSGGCRGGRKEYTGTVTHTGFSAAQAMTGTGLSSQLIACYGWKRCLTDAETSSILNNPFQIFRKYSVIPTNYEPYLMPIGIPRGGRPE